MIYHSIKFQNWFCRAIFILDSALGFWEVSYKKKKLCTTRGIQNFWKLKKKYYCRANFPRTKKIFFSKYFNRTNQRKTKESFFSSNSSFKIAFKSNKSLKSKVASQDHHNQTVKILWRKNQYSIEHYTFLLISHFLFYFCFYSFIWFCYFCVFN